MIDSTPLTNIATNHREFVKNPVLDNYKSARVGANGNNRIIVEKLILQSESPKRKQQIQIVKKRIENGIDRSMKIRDQDQFNIKQFENNVKEEKFIISKQSARDQAEVKKFLQFSTKRKEELDGDLKKMEELLTDKMKEQIKAEKEKEKKLIEQNEKDKSLNIQNPTDSHLFTRLPYINDAHQSPDQYISMQLKQQAQKAEQLQQNINGYLSQLYGDYFLNRQKIQNYSRPNEEKLKMKETQSSVFESIKKQKLRKRLKRKAFEDEDGIENVFNNLEKLKNHYKKEIFNTPISEQILIMKELKSETDSKQKQLIARYMQREKKFDEKYMQSSSMQNQTDILQSNESQLVNQSQTNLKTLYNNSITSENDFDQQDVPNLTELKMQNIQLHPQEFYQFFKYYNEELTKDSRSILLNINKEDLGHMLKSRKNQSHRDIANPLAGLYALQTLTFINQQQQYMDEQLTYMDKVVPNPQSNPFKSSLETSPVASTINQSQSSPQLLQHSLSLQSYLGNRQLISNIGAEEIVEENSPDFIVETPNKHKKLPSLNLKSLSRENTLHTSINQSLLNSAHNQSVATIASFSNVSCQIPNNPENQILLLQASSLNDLCELQHQRNGYLQNKVNQTQRNIGNQFHVINQEVGMIL